MRQSLRNTRKIIRTLTNSAYGQSTFSLLHKGLRPKEKTARDGLSRAASASIGGCP
jgi:hypothetical protein